jgi:hypothetical protein
MTKREHPLLFSIGMDRFSSIRWDVDMRIRSYCSIGVALLLGLACNSKSDGPDDGQAGETEGISASATESTPGDADGDSHGDADASAGETDDSGQDTDQPSTDSTGSTDPTEGGECQIATCHGKIYECGDCIDNDGDGLIDVADPSCWGPCDNNEEGWKGEIPGQQDNPTCERMACYWDGNSGHGESKCLWSHACDPLEPMGCEYDPNAHFPEPQVNNCGSLFAEQPEGCEEYCGPYTPNGCDCFGCCEVHVGGSVHTVYVGTEDRGGGGTCNVSTADDSDKCHPCTPVEACFKACNPDDCQICIGQTEIPEGCDEAKCPDGVQSCNPQNGHADCPETWSCITGCCWPPPQ